jgi:hypothetical protein
MTEYRKKEVRMWKCGDVMREEIQANIERDPLKDNGTIL